MSNTEWEWEGSFKAEDAHAIVYKQIDEALDDANSFFHSQAIFDDALQDASVSLFFEMDGDAITATWRIETGDDAEFYDFDRFANMNEAREFCVKAWDKMVEEEA